MTGPRRSESVVATLGFGGRRWLPCLGSRPGRPQGRKRAAAQQEIMSGR